MIGGLLLMLVLALALLADLEEQFKSESRKSRQLDKKILDESAQVEAAMAQLAVVRRHLVAIEARMQVIQNAAELHRGMASDLRSIAPPNDSA